MINYILLLLGLSIPVLTHAGLIDDPLLKNWSTVMKGAQGGNRIESFERQIKTPYSQYTVAQLTNTEFYFQGPKTVDSVRKFLSHEFKLTGLQEKTIGDSFRFEGYRPDINRQVVVFVSFGYSKIKVSSGFYRPAYGRVIALEVELLHRKYHGLTGKVSRFPALKLLNPFIEEAYAQTDCTKCAGNPMCLLLCRSGNTSTGGGGGGFIPGMDLTEIQNQLVSSNTQLSALNVNLGAANTNIAGLNTNLSGMNTNWANSNTQIGNLNSTLNTQLGTFNQNYANTNTQLDNLNNAINNQVGNLNNQLGTFNQNYANTNTQIGNLNNTLNTQLGNFNQNYANTNTQIGVFNQNHANSNVQIGNLNTTINTQLGTFNQNYANTNAQIEEANKNLVNLTNMADKRAGEALQESQAWRAMTEKESKEWRALVSDRSDRGLIVAEKMSDPNHVFKIATYSAVGAVLGATVANLAISGVTTAVTFLYKWASGELKEMKQNELLAEFSKAMKVYEDSSKISQALEMSIDSALANMALHKKFKLENSEVLANIQKYILETEFQIEDAKKNRCIDELVPLNQKLVEFQSMAKILDLADPQKKMCLDIKEMFRKLAEVEGLLQNSRPNLLKAEEALNWKLSREQNQGAKIFGNIRDGKLADKVKKTQDKQRKKLYKRNIEDTEDLIDDIVADCRDSLRSHAKLKRSDLKKYCASIINNKDAASADGLSSSFPMLSDEQKNAIIGEFKQKHISLGIDKVAAYEQERKNLFSDFENESKRHHEEVQNLKDRVQQDPRIALNEMKAINEFVEKIMKEQAYIYSDGMKIKKAQFEEACQSLSE